MYFEHYKVFDINNLKDIELNKFTLIRYRIPNPRIGTINKNNWRLTQSKFWLKCDEGLLINITDKALIFDSLIVNIKDFKVAHQILPWVELDLLKVDRWLEEKSKLT